MSAAAGFSLVETLVALTLTVVLTSAALALTLPAHGIFQSQPQATDMQQRLRAAVDAVAAELAMAGAGPDAGEDAGSLVHAFASVLPRKIGLAASDAATVARSDAITISYVPKTAAQTTTSDVVPQAAGLAVNTAPNCPWGQPLCGFQAGMSIVVFDETAHFDVFTIVRLQGNAAQLQSHSSWAPYVYPSGSRVTEVTSRSFYFDVANGQLRQYDGYQSDVPVVDNVVALSFAYFGDPNPPLRPKPPADTENCLYDAAGNLKTMPVLASPGAGIVPLPLAMFGDGPWCGAGDTQFDADLLRVRAVRMTIRVQATAAEFRSSGPRFVKPGTSRASSRYLPDLTATLDVAPRNLSAGQ